MAKLKPDKKSKKKRRKDSVNRSSDLSPKMAQQFVDQATELLRTGQPDEALKVAKKALKCLSTPELLPITQLPALELLGEVYVELGEPDLARKMFTNAAELDPHGDLPEADSGGPDKFLWLAQLCEEGGLESVQWFQKGIRVLRREIELLTEREEEEEELTSLKRNKLAEALCGIAEVYMTDLSWEDEAEAICESSVTEACMVAPNAPEPLQTLASVRISQSRLEDARSALKQSLELWQQLDPEHPSVPDFPTRISLSRLLMEAQMEEQALEVLDRLVSEDDSSVEAWYLGGWCLNLLTGKQKATGEVSPSDSKERESKTMQLYKSSRIWLMNSLKLYQILNYEDERLRDHALEIVEELNKVLGPPDENEEDECEDEDDDYEDIVSENKDEDEQMEDT